MIKLLPFIIIPILLVLGFGAWRILGIKTPISIPSPVSTEKTDKSDNVTSVEPVEVPKTLPQATNEEKIATLESAVDTLVKEINTLKTENTALNTKIKSVEGTETNLLARVSALEKASPAPASTSKSTIYIPLGAGGSWTNQDWYTLTDYQVTLDPANFPGYTGMILEATFRMVESAGTASVRLYNVTDNVAVASSDISTTATSFSSLTSSSFKLASGNKTYALQVKSTQEKTVFIQIARIRVNF